MLCREQILPIEWFAPKPRCIGRVKHHTTLQVENTQVRAGDERDQSINNSTDTSLQNYRTRPSRLFAQSREEQNERRNDTSSLTTTPSTAYKTSCLIYFNAYFSVLTSRICSPLFRDPSSFITFTTSVFSGVIVAVNLYPNVLSQGGSK